MARVGEIIQHQYRVTTATAGKGVFSCVVKAEKLKPRHAKASLHISKGKLSSPSYT